MVSVLYLYDNTVGAVGSLLAAHLSRHTRHAVKTIVRSTDLYNDRSKQPRDITIERDGTQLHVSDIEVELIPPQRDLTEAQVGHPFINENIIQKQRLEDRQHQVLGKIDSLFVTTKAPAVIPAIQQILPRLASTSTIVLLQNGGGVVDALIDEVFPDESLRPNFVVGVNTHGTFVRNVVHRPSEDQRRLAMHTVWAGVGNIPFGVMPNKQIRDCIEQSGRADTNPLANLASTGRPSLDCLPSASVADSLRLTLSAMLACAPLNFEWLAWPELLRVQQAKIAVNCVINPLTAIFDVQNGVLFPNPGLERMAFRICEEVSSVFAEQSRRNLAKSLETVGPTPSEDEEYLLSTGAFPSGHALSPEGLLSRVLQVARVTDANVSSTLADVRNGHANTEIDFMNGYITRLGHEYGIPTPVNDSLVDMTDFKAGLGRIAQYKRRDAEAIPRNLAGMRITNRFGATYKPEKTRTRQQNFLARRRAKADANAEDLQGDIVSEYSDSDV